MAFTVLTSTGVFNPIDPLQGAYLMVATTVVLTVCWLAVRLLTSPSPETALVACTRADRARGPGRARPRSADRQ